jgi:hypothetical protein
MCLLNTPKYGAPTNALRRSVQLVLLGIVLTVLGSILPQSAVAADSEVASITGTTWLDLNMNQLQDEEDTTYAECIVFLEEVNPAEPDVIGTAVAWGDEQGNFTFHNVQVGVYVLWAEMGHHVSNSITQTGSIDLLMPPYTSYLPLIARP